jgi:hypothetical protein
MCYGPNVHNSNSGKVSRLRQNMTYERVMPSDETQPNTRVGEVSGRTL